MCVKVIASQRWDVFWDTVYTTLQLLKPIVNIYNVYIAPCNVKSYCLPALLYGCEVWHLNDSHMHKISIAWNNCFRCIFSCCWRESVKPLTYNIFAIHFQYHRPTCYISANHCFEKSWIALILLFYSHYLVACIRLLLLWAVCIIKCAIVETVKQLSQRTDLEFICRDCGLVIYVILFVFLCF